MKYVTDCILRDHILHKVSRSDDRCDRNIYDTVFVERPKYIDDIIYLVYVL